MDNRFWQFSFAGSSSITAFESLSKFGHVGGDHGMDTMLRLDSPFASGPQLSSSKVTKRKWSSVGGCVGGCTGLEDGSSLVLGLGRSPSSSDSKGSSATVCTMSSAKETDEESSVDLGLNFQLHLGSEKTSSLKKPAVHPQKSVDMDPNFHLQLSLSTGPAESDITSIIPSSTHHHKNIESDIVSAIPSLTQHQNNFGAASVIGTMPVMDEGSTSSHWKLRGALPSLFTNVNPQSTEPSFNLNPISCKTDLIPSAPDLSTTVTTPKSSVTCTSGLTQQRSSSAKNCQFQGCGKGARGASGLCIAHGGGRRCQKAGCHKGAEGRTVYCKAHGGGRRCQYLGCTKSAEGRTDYCIAHGGGRRCSHEGCTRAARGKSGLCIRHGGGKRCQKENCTKSAEGFSGLCISHGGGRRCQFLACSKGAQGSTMFCKAHGGGKRCTVLGCTKGAEGSTPFCKGHGGGKRCSFEGGCPKSVHGGTKFCVAHGGGKRCAVADCTKSARGRTDFCVRHGGGKRCKSEGCGKSAQGSTNFCKAHGGGKRCSWGQPPGSDSRKNGDGAQVPCDRFARGKTGLCAAHSALVQDQRVHGGGTLGPEPVPPSIQGPRSGKPDKMKEVVNEEMHVDITVTRNREDATSWKGPDQEVAREIGLGFQPVGRAASIGIGHGRYTNAEISLQLQMQQATSPIRKAEMSSPVSLPEGRVHGGSLMSMLARGTGLESRSSTENKPGGAVASENGRSFVMTRWM